MQRWIAIRASAVLAIIGGVSILLVSVLMAAAFVLFPMRDRAALSPAVLKAAGILIALLFAALSAWSIATGIGVFRRRGWARISILVLGALLLFFGGTGVLTLLFISFPMQAEVDLRGAGLVRGSLIAFYALLALSGAAWLAVFTRRSAKTYFAEAAAGTEPAPPLSISMIGWCLLAGAAHTAIAAALGGRLPFFGWVAAGWEARALYTLYTAVQVYLGAGLLQLDEKARVWSIVFLCLAGVNGAVFLAQPGFADRIQLPELFQNVAPAFLPMVWLLGWACLVSVAVPIWFLVRRRSAFGTGSQLGR